MKSPPLGASRAAAHAQPPTPVGVLLGLCLWATTACAAPTGAPPSSTAPKGAPPAVVPVTSMTPPPLVDTRPATLLAAVEDEVVRVRQAGSRHPVVVFDLDATLFDNRERTRAILAELALEPEVAGTAHGAALRRLKAEQVVYGVGDTLKAVGIDDGAFVERAVAWWLPRFFGEYAVHDRVVPGGPEYVRRLYDAGAFVVYLSGRDRERMLHSTVHSLAISGYPIGLDRTQLILKPKATADDEAFKQAVMASLGRLGTVVGLFDNEPGNVNLMRRAFPAARVIFLRTMHAPGAPAVGAGIESIDDYTFEP